MRKTIPFIIILTIVSVTIYAAIVTFSESRDYGKTSLDYYLLTPKELSQLSMHCENSPRFIYSSADGSKPAIIHLHCYLEQKIVNNYLNQNKFEQASNNQFKKGAIEIGFEKDDNDKIILTTVYEYL